MEQLQNYVDVCDYCEELSEITSLSLDEVKDVVFLVFGFINAGILESYKGFLIIESQLTKKMGESKNRNSIVLAS